MVKKDINGRGPDISKVGESLDQIFQRSEVQFRDQAKRFITESGKHLAIAIGTIITFLITGQVIPDSLYVTTFVFAPLMIVGVIIYSIWWFSSKEKEELRQDLMQLARSHKKLGDEFASSITLMEQKLVGRIKTLEAYTPYGIVDIDLSTGLLVQCNRQFEFLVGWNVNTLNQHLTIVPPELRPAKLAQLLAHPEDAEDLLQEFQQRFMGDLEPKKVKDIYLLNRDGRFFPATLTGITLDEPKGFVAQYYLSDDTDVRAMMETIQGQNDTINRILELYTQSQTEKEHADLLIKKLEQMRMEIHDKARGKPHT